MSDDKNLNLEREETHLDIISLLVLLSVSDRLTSADSIPSC